MSQLKKYPIKICLLLVLASVIAWGLTGCVSQEQPSLSELFTATPEITSTPTIVWFPPTATMAIESQATATPNPAEAPIFGLILFNDSFTDAALWPTPQSADGVILVADNSLTLAVKTTPGSLLTLRPNSIANNFYLETTLNRVSFCNQNDQIGIVFRAQGEQSFYRLLLNCQGEFALQQVVGGTVTVLTGWTPSGEIPLELYKPVKVGIWTYGPLIRIYLNDKLQTEVTRTTFSSGEVGYYARASSDTPLTVSFSDLNVYQVDNNSLVPSAATATP
jgi:hypothetical protein